MFHGRHGRRCGTCARCWSLVAAAAAIFGKSISLNTSIGHGPSRFADHRDVAIPNSPTQPLALARFNMPSRLGDGNIIAWWAHTYASRHC